jgi:hypothetical protein
LIDLGLLHLEKKIFKNSQCIFFYSFAIISPWRGAFPFILRNLNPLPLRMICAKLVKIGPIVLERNIFK